MVLETTDLMPHCECAIAANYAVCVNWVSASFSMHWSVWGNIGNMKIMLARAW